jgi:Uma2 family endonuclease
MSTQPKMPLLTEEEYLAIERKAAFKSEYFQGEMFAMAGAREPHNLLAANLLALIHQQFRGRPCRVYPSDMRVNIPSVPLYTYPDVSALCQEPEFRGDSRDNLLNPTFIAEVLSESTESYDRGRKFELYQSLSSLREYLLISSDRVRVELYTIQPSGKWLLTTASRLDDTIALDSICCRITVSDLYDKVELDARPLRSETAHP